MKHFILTRFNILLWQKDKEGRLVRTMKWQEHRFSIFERCCLPSIMNQTCQEFEWIVLFDSKTPVKFKERINCYQKECPQLLPVFVEPENGRYFAKIFRTEIVKRLRQNEDKNYKKVLTTYLDNDDALNVSFVEDLQKRASLSKERTFFYYNEGYQFYTDYNYMMKIHYPRNHFVSVVESGNLATLKGIFGYGSHYSIDKKEGLRIERIKNLPMWCEVVHEKNMINDANFFIGVKMVRDSDLLRREFAIDKMLRTEIGIYVFRFLPRYCRTFVKRAKNKLFGRKW